MRTEQERIWIQNASYRGGSFIATFANACMYADDQNFEILRPVLAQLMKKYSGYSNMESAPASAS